MGISEPQGLFVGMDGAIRRVRVKGGPLFEAFHGIGEGLRQVARDLGVSKPDLGRAYASEAWAYRCVKLRADALAGVPLILVDRAGKRIEDHPILDLLRDVNPYTMNLGDLMRATESAYNIWGSAYWLKVMAGPSSAPSWVRPNGAGGGRVKALQWLNPQTIEVMSDPIRGITGYKQTFGAQTRLYAPEEVIAFRNFDPLDDLGGLSPLSVAISEVNAELNASRFVASFFANDARPAGLLTTDQALNESEMERTRTWWQKLFQGAENRWRTGIVGAGMKWQTISHPPGDLALSDLRAEDRRAICAVFGVPPALAGAWEAANFAASREQKASFYEDTMIPQMEYIAEVLNWSLLRAHYPDLAAQGARLAFDVEGISALRETANEKAARMTMLFQAGIMTRDEERAELNMLPDEASPPGPNSPAIAERGSGDGETRVEGASADVMQPEAERVKADLARWERFAVRRLKAGKPMREFKSTDIPPNLWWQVASALSDVRGIEDVHAVFQQAVAGAWRTPSHPVPALVGAPRAPGHPAMHESHGVPLQEVDNAIR